MNTAIEPQPSPVRTSDWQRVAVIWLLVLGSYVAYHFYPAFIPVVLPGVVLLISRAFVPTQFPHFSRPVWLTFWFGQLVLLIGAAFVHSVRSVGLVLVSLGSVAIFVWLAFIVVSDAVLIRRSLQLRQPR